MRAEEMQGAVVQPPGDDPTASVAIHHEIERNVFDKKLGVMLEALLIERVQQRVPGPVGGGAGALGQFPSPMQGVAAKRALVNVAVGGAGERHAEMLEF